MEQNKIYRPVKQLSPEVARKIAAGEVIDRPNAIVRELLDNAIDSGAKSITLEIAGGGIDKIRITDDGAGMTKEDLIACAKPHATSKITSESDLLSLNTLGFRGEALASIAAVSRLEITTRRENNPAYHLEAQLTDEHIITPSVLEKGTIVQSQSLFENIPARRIFLKRPASEANLCKQTFIEKSLPNPQINFKFINDGTLKLDLPATSSLIQRCIQALELKVSEKLFYEIEGNDNENNEWSYKLIVGDSSIYRNDKKNIHIFVNGRKITEYSLVQAIDYGTEGSFPNGTHPVACLFLNIDSKLVDFNIHPAKKEAKFKDLSQIHHSVSSSLKNIFLQSNKKAMFEKAEYQPTLEYDNFESKSHFTKITKENSDLPNQNYNSTSDFSDSVVNSKTTGYSNSSDFSSNKKHSSYFQNEKTSTSKENLEFANKIYQEAKNQIYPEQDFSETEISSSINENKISLYEKQTSPEFKYLGSAFNVFLFVEKDEKIYVIDQHAAHERILFEQFLKTAGEKQQLLFPYEFEIESESQNEYLESIKNEMLEAGFTLEKIANSDKWQVTTIPIKWQGNKQSLFESIFEKKYEPKDFLRNFLATCACKAAIKEGTYIDEYTAKDIIKKTFALEDPHCPHGRPIWFILTQDELYQRVRRT